MTPDLFASSGPVGQKVQENSDKVATLAQLRVREFIVAALSFVFRELQNESCAQPLELYFINPVIVHPLLV